MEELSPMMKQYKKIKSEYKGTILFFRLGSFYEMFYDDAKIVSRELELTLTAKDCGKDKKAPMCGMPYHSSEAYIKKLVEKGYKIAICEQVEDAATAKGIVERKVTRVVTKGTIMEGSILDESQNNYICSIYTNNNAIGLCFCDISTGTCEATYLSDDLNRKLTNELAKFDPHEILICPGTVNFNWLSLFIKDRLKAVVELLDESEYKNANEVVENHFKKSISDLALSDKLQTVGALGALINYLKRTQMVGLERINNVVVYNDAKFMGLGLNERRNLEIIETMRSKEKKGSLLWVIDKTKSAIGKRNIRMWLERPLLNVKDINLRQEAVEELMENRMLCDELMKHISNISDIERLMTRIVYGSANARDLRLLCTTAKVLPEIKNLLKDVKSTSLRNIFNNIDELEDIYNLINNSIVENPPFTLQDGGLIKEGFNKEIDSLHVDMKSGKGYIAKIEFNEKEKTGIPTLKIGYNKVFGYYIEVSNSYKNKVPDTYIRKQTLTNCERFITQELKDLEGRVLGAKDRVAILEYELFNEIRSEIALKLNRVQNTAKALGDLDAFCSFAVVAIKNNYCKPKVDNSGEISIKEGRHPVVEQLLTDVPFVPNDTFLNNDDERIIMVTGPNMAGKSIYMRQIALICLMAQTGSFVPASFAKIGIVDNIFTRVGASDDLLTGQSTFMVEMNEVAEILRQSTKDSLIILDEIGRGTSTYDGMSIARAVLEYVSDKNKLGAKTLFSTHYHELTELENEIEGIKNYNMAVKKRGDNITFLRRIVRGSADDSYGVEVAKLAGIPDEIVDRANVILHNIEAHLPVSGNINYKNNNIAKSNNDIELNKKEKEIIGKIKTIDADTLSPLEALKELFELKKLVKEE